MDPQPSPPREDAVPTKRQDTVLLWTVINNAPVVLFWTDPEGVILFSRGKALEPLGLKPDELVGQSVFDLYREEPAVADSARRALSGEVVTSRLQLGEIVHETRFAPIRDAAGTIGGILGVATDITERARAEAELERLAFRDVVTGLPNRLAFARAIDREIAEQPDLQPLAVVEIGLNRFRDVNSTYGFDYGDRTLRAVAERLSAAFEPASAVVGKLAGDEFGLLIRDAARLDSVEALGEQVLAQFDAPFLVGEDPTVLEARAGVALYPGHGDTADLLLRRANVALHEAATTATGVAGYRQDRDGPRINNVQLLRELRQAIDRDELALYYQPKVEAASGAVSGVEALLRWRHPSRGVLPPGAFMALSERTGIIHRLRPWVISAAAKQLVAWAAEGRETGRVAVNLSARAFSDRRLPEQVESLLDLWGVPGERLEFEITETAIMADPQRAIETCARLREMGITLAIDDFGTGHSPLVYLQRLDPHSIKIDMSFVQDLGRPETEAIVRSIIDLGRRLELTTVAEGVEDEATHERLSELGCDQMQGYLFSRPLPPAELAAWLDAR